MVLQNNSRETVSIRHVFKSCDCTAGSIDRSRLEPGETTSFAVDWDVGGSRGVVERLVGVMYQVGNKSALHPLDIRLKAIVDPDVRLSSESLEFDTASGEQQRVLVVTPGRQPDVSILDAYSAHPAFHVRLEQPVNNDQLWQVIVGFDPTQWTNDEEVATVVVATSSQREPTIRVPIVVPQLNAAQPEASASGQYDEGAPSAQR
jgi:hypothetical protein